MERNIFELATRQALRYPSARGELTTEQLWDLPLTHRTGFDLDHVARDIARFLREEGEESFVETKVKPAITKANLALEVVKHIIGVKQAEATAAQAKVEKAELRERLQKAIANKQNQALETADLADLQAQLKALED
jgi:hypothetical protein